MLIPILIDHPQVLGAVVRGTPTWVWFLLAGLLWLGLSQALPRRVHLRRVMFGPVALTGLSLWGLGGAFGSSPTFTWALLAWALCAAAAFAFVASRQVPSGTVFDATSGRFFIPGSWVPMVTILGIFLIRYVVNVDLAMSHALALDGKYTLAVGALYGLCSGVILGRAGRLWRLAAGRGVRAASALRT